MVILRLFARVYSSHPFGADDWLVGAAIIPGVAYTVCISIAVTHFGWDRHIYDIVPGPGNINEVKEQAISWAVQNLYFWTADLTKLSMLCFYRRAFTTPMMQKLVMLFLVITLLFHLVCLLLLCLECRPLNFYWEQYRVPAPAHGWCGNEGAGCRSKFPKSITLRSDSLIIRNLLSGGVKSSLEAGSWRTKLSLPP